MKSIILLAISLFTIICFQNCGTHSDVRPAGRPPITQTDIEFIPYIQEFESYYGKTVGHVPIGFADLDKKIAGVCYRSIVGRQILRAYILIDKDYWYLISEYQRINLIFHELGHCVLNRDHVHSDSVTLCPKSFMFEQVISNSCLQQNYYDYIEEMFP